MDKGRIIATGSPCQLIEQYVTKEVVELRFPPGQVALAAERAGQFAERVETVADPILIYTGDGDATAGHVASGRPVTATMFVRRAGLEDVFLSLTGRHLVD